MGSAGVGRIGLGTTATVPGGKRTGGGGERGTIDMPGRLILEAPQARVALLRGMDRMTALLRPTLGPTARTVAIQGLSKTSAPEILDSAATIARRTIQIDNPWEDMGAMIVRQLAWTV